NYSDTYRERVEELIDHKRHGEIVVTEGPARPARQVVDLMDALQASVAAARDHRPGNAKVAPLVPAGKAKKEPSRRSASAGGRAAAPRGGDLSELSKAELAKRAAELGIEGRSKMTRDELEQAVAEAATPSRTPARRRRAS
ncbi:MAG TPA: hypothetical protein VMF60_06035, partial [Acidimicrobiales bacterium]|nr:hypothetical protein [Acidimicrobiales bacterium]